ncbi:MAG: c-type cytochrome [Planctomycetales bacterium]|nr:c-type cytochrome [Planctomycetales bacterium]
MQFPPMCCFRSIPLLFVSWSFFCFATSFAVGQDGETLRLEIDSLEQDYAQQLPRIAPHEARESLDTFTLDTRFRIEQVAAEPLVTDPVAIAFDEWGRAYVVEMRGYSEDDQQVLGVVRLLEDTDHDGRFDQAHLFADQLAWPTAIAVTQGGILVGAAPDILFLKDTDGDHQADVREVVFTGFRKNNVQGLLNSFIWGLDGFLYGSSSSNGGVIESLRHAGTSAIPLDRRDFRMDTSDMTLSPVDGGGQHGMSFDVWGERFVTQNSDHLQWLEFEDRYLRRNPALLAPAMKRSIAADGPAAEVFRTSPVEPWRIVRTRLRVKNMVSGPIEGGGQPAGYFTGATGVTIFQGDAFSDKWNDKTLAFIGDVGSNLVHCKLIQDQGLNKTGVRLLPNVEFLTSTDIWFRPVQFANGPSGGLYVLDMYREVIEHPASLPPLIKRHLDLTSGRERGRIYQIVAKEHTNKVRKTPGEMSTPELVQTLAHSNGWHRETAARLLMEQPNAEAVPLLMEWIKTSNSPIAVVRAAYCLQRAGQLDTDSLVALLKHANAQVRRHGLRLAERHLDQSAVVQQVVSMASDRELLVRYQLAYTLGELAWSQRSAALWQLIRSDGAHAKMRIAITSSLADGEIETLQQLLTSNSVTSATTPLIRQIVSQVGQQRDASEIVNVITQIQQANQADHFPLLSLLLQSTRLAHDDLLSLLRESKLDQPDAFLAQLLTQAITIARDASATKQRRIAAIQTMALAELDDVNTTLRLLLTNDQPLEINAAALETCGSFATDIAGKILIDHLETMAPSLQTRSIELLMSRTNWTQQLLGAMQADLVRPQTLSIRQRQQLLSHVQPEVRRMASELLGELPSRANVVQQYMDVLQMEGNVDRGRAIFGKVCATCHLLHGEGHRVGPELTPFTNRGALYFLTNILDPSQEVDVRYAAHSVVLNNGATLSGIVSAESSETITLLREEAKADVIPRPEILEVSNTGKSLMPEGLESDLGKQGVADVIAFLLSYDKNRPASAVSSK